MGKESFKKGAAGTPAGDESYKSKRGHLKGAARKAGMATRGRGEPLP